MKFSFFKSLASAIISRLKSKVKVAPPNIRQIHRKLKRDGNLQRLAKAHGDALRLSAWNRSVQGGYDEKRKLVNAGKGHNTLAGIPA